MTLANTGERLIPDAESEPWNVQVHLERYGFARRFVRDSVRVLDYGCGVGYGIHALTELTQGECVGVDKEEAVAFARTRYPHPRLRFVAADLTDSAARFGAFDVIVSFDVMEHVDDLGAYLDNIAAQLRDAQSVAIISTPWSPRRDNVKPLHNPYHEVELTFTEFSDALCAKFCIAEWNLSIGMMAVVKHRDGNCQTPTVIEVTTEHLRAMEQMLDAVSVEHERLLPLDEAVEDLLSVRSRRPLSRAVVQRVRQRFRPPPATSYVEVFSVQARGLGGIAFAHRCTTDRGQLEVGVWHEGEQVARELIPLCMLNGRSGHRMAFAPRASAPGERVEVRFQAHGTDLRSLGLTASEAEGPRCTLLYRRYHWRGAPTFVQDVVWMQESNGQLVRFERMLPTDPTDLAEEARPVTLRPRMLPPIDQRPWEPQAGILTKVRRSLRAYGLRATLREIAAYLRR